LGPVTSSDAAKVTVAMANALEPTRLKTSPRFRFHTPTTSGTISAVCSRG